MLTSTNSSSCKASRKAQAMAWISPMFMSPSCSLPTFQMRRHWSYLLAADSTALLFALSSRLNPFIGLTIICLAGTKNCTAVWIVRRPLMKVSRPFWRIHKLHSQKCRYLDVSGPHCLPVVCWCHRHLHILWKRKKVLWEKKNEFHIVRPGEEAKQFFSPIDWPPSTSVVRDSITLPLPYDHKWRRLLEKRSCKTSVKIVHGTPC